MIIATTHSMRLRMHILAVLVAELHAGGAAAIAGATRKIYLKIS